MQNLDRIVMELVYNFNGNRRYQTIIFIVTIPTTIAVKEILEFVHSLERRLLDKGIPCESIDLFKDVVAKGEIPLGDTGNTFNDLIDWIKIKAKSTKRCLLIYEIDPLLSTE